MLLLRSCKLIGVFVIHPCLPFCWNRYKQHGSFAPRTLLRFAATMNPSATLSSSANFPGSPVIWLPCSADFSTGRGGLLQLLSMSLSSCCRYRPARVSCRISQIATIHAAFTPRLGVRPLGLFTFEVTMRALLLRPDDSLPSQGWFRR